VRTFRLIRDEDVSGVSGTGYIARGYAFFGLAFLRWIGEWPTLTIHWRGIKSVEAVHGHSGRTRIVWD